MFGGFGVMGVGKDVECIVVLYVYRTSLRFFFKCGYGVYVTVWWIVVTCAG